MRCEAENTLAHRPTIDVSVDEHPPDKLVSHAEQPGDVSAEIAGPSQGPDLLGIRRQLLQRRKNRSVIVVHKIPKGVAMCIVMDAGVTQPTRAVRGAAVRVTGWFPLHGQR